MTPLAAWSLFFALGIAVEHCLAWPAEVLSLSAFLFLAACFMWRRRRRRFFVFLFLAAFAAGGLRLRLAETGPITDFAATGSGALRQEITLRGVVISDPDTGKRATTFLIRSEEITSEGARCEISGRIPVRKFGAVFLNYGDKIVVRGRFHVEKSGFGRGDERLVFVVRKNQEVRHLGEGRGYFFGRATLSLKHRWERTLEAALPPSSAAVLLAMLFGEGERVAPHLRQAMIASGTWHVMVVSGTNTSLLAFIFLLILKIARVPRRLRFVSVIAGLLLYCFMTGGSAPVLRATVMSVALLLAYLAQRHPLFIHSFCLAGFLILLFDPLQLFSVGFQLSFLSVFAIAVLFDRLKDLFAHEVFQRPVVLSGVVACLCVSMAAWLGTAPLLAYRFGTVSLSAVFANTLIVPLSGVVLLSGVALLGVGVFFPFWAHIFAAAADFLIFIFLKLNMAIAAWPWGVLRVPPFSFLILCGIYSFIFGTAAFFCHLKRSFRLHFSVAWYKLIRHFPDVFFRKNRENPAGPAAVVEHEPEGSQG